MVRLLFSMVRISKLERGISNTPRSPHDPKVRHILASAETLDNLN